MLTPTGYGLFSSENHVVEEIFKLFLPIWVGLEEVNTHFPEIRVSTLPKKVQISVQNSVQPQIKFVQYSSVTVKLTISKKQFFLPNVGLVKIRSSTFFWRV